MPELPDVELYVAALHDRIVGGVLDRVRLVSPFLLRSVEPALAAANGRSVAGVARLGKRIVIELDGALYLVIHLMVAGRLRFRDRDARLPGRIGLAAFDFDRGTLLFTEAGKKKRASLHVVSGADGLAEHDRGGLEPLDVGLDAFAERLRCENHTLKRALTDPTLFSGIGNAYSDEILHRAKLPPTRWTSRLGDAEVERLWRATREVLGEWVERLRAECAGAFPEKVTAFRPQMAAHGRYGEPCPDCGDPIQRIRYSDNESNYCATCQTGGKLLADRALSRLLKGDWPKSLEELENRKRSARG